MGAGPVARGALVAVAAAPALVWYAPPAAPLLAAMAAVLAIAAALHGLGRAVGALCGDDDAPVALAIAWGLAAYLALGGLLVALGAFADVGQRLVQVGGVAAGAAWFDRRLVRGPAPRRGWWRPSLAAAVPALAVAIAAIAIVGWAGTWQGPFFDGEVYHLGALGRLASAGDLADGIAVPRGQGLGGSVLVSSLASAFGDWRAAHAIDHGLALALVLALLLHRLPRGRTGVLIGFVLVTLVSMTPEFRLDLLPRWTTVALVLALHRTLARAYAAGRPPWAAVLVAGALATLSHGGLAAALVISIAVVRAAPAGGRRRWGALAFAVLAAAAGGLVVAAVRADGGAFAIAGGPARALVRLAVWGAAAAIVHSLAALALRDVRDRALALTFAAACAAAAITGALAPTIAMGWRSVEPLGLALVLLVIAPAFVRPIARGPVPLTVVALVLTTMALATARFPLGQPAIPWARREGHLVVAARALATAGLPDDRGERAAYRDAQAAIPAGARVGLWVDRGDLVDHRRHRVVDLRNGATAACVHRDRAWRAWTRTPGGCRRLDALLARGDLDYLIVAPSIIPRADIGGLTCRFLRGSSCLDPLRAFLAGRPAIDAGGLLVVDARRAPR